MVALIDYKAGNLTSVRKALAAVGASVFTPDSPDDLARAAALIVPGVGHFAATRVLDASWIAAIRDLVENGRPLLGICLGMQWLYEGSDEASDCPGLGVLKGRCYRLGATERLTSEAGQPGASRDTPAGLAVKIPHVGWNALARTRHGAILDGVPDRSQVYFTHSYVAPVTADTVAQTEHGERFASVVQRDRIAGVQFHPEKSGEIGLQVLRNFLRLA
jgi:glutamine amidotransferase